MSDPRRTRNWSATEVPVEVLDTDTSTQRRGVIIVNLGTSIGRVYGGWGQSDIPAFSVVPGDEKSIEMPAIAPRKLYLWCDIHESAAGTLTPL